MAEPIKTPKTYKIEIKSAEQFSMESDHFTLVSPRTCDTAYVRPHRQRTSTGDILTREEANRVISIWRDTVTAYDVYDKSQKYYIDLTSEDLHLINKVKGY